MIGIIKYKAGNLASVSNALERLGDDYFISDSAEELSRADGIIFPGVGHARAAMDDLRSKNLDSWLRNTQKSVLGICLGMQLLYESSEEGSTAMLGVIPGHLKKFDSRQAKVPHMGWNKTLQSGNHPLFKGIGGDPYFYYVHSYHASVDEFTIATSKYIQPFTAACTKHNFMGVQFHPEKSGEAGSRLLQNFLDIVAASNN